MSLPTGTIDFSTTGTNIIQEPATFTTGFCTGTTPVAVEESKEYKKIKRDFMKLIFHRELEGFNWQIERVETFPNPYGGGQTKYTITTTFAKVKEGRRK